VGNHVIAQADIARVAVLAPVAGQAAVGVVREDNREHSLAAVLHFLSISANHHVLLHDSCAGELQARRALDIDEARAATGVRFQAIDVAKTGDIEPVVLQDFDQWRRR
jgi:hypothetical protein